MPDASGASEAGGPNTACVAGVASTGRRREHEASSRAVDAGTIAEIAALRRLATAVASESDTYKICDLAAKEVALHMGVDAVLVCRFEGGVARVIGQWSEGPHVPDPELPLVGHGALAEVASTAQPARVDDDVPLRDDPVAPVVGHISRASVAAPLMNPEGMWGAVLASTASPEDFAPDAEQRLAEFAELVGMAISNAADRARLVELVAQDPLTGLANHRTFVERLEQEIQRATRHGHALSLVVIDVDGFKQLNAQHGHAVGDQVLTGLARHLRSAARSWDVLARLGGDEFAWLLPHSEIDGAQQAAERVHHVIASSPAAGVGRITVSMGICDLSRARDAEHLVGYAVVALNAAKRHGGNTVGEYEAPAPSATAPVRETPRLDQTHTLASVYALSRAVDARDPSMREHSRRVADLAGHLARVLGWPPTRAVRLREAGLLHDVGKIGVPDAILLKAAPLTPEEYAVAKTHAEAGARIIEGLFGAEQVLWVRHHHERHDGRGYPDGLSGDSIPDGARILAVADSWDVMISGRPYKAALSTEQALQECRRLAGTQFAPDVVHALGQLWDSGAFTDGLGHLAAYD